MELHKRLCAAEMSRLAEDGRPDQYLIIRLLSPLSPPPPEDLARITDAVRTLAELGMLAGRGDHE